MKRSIKYIIFYDSPGQMCNRFWSYIDSVAWAIENGGKIIVLFWDKSIKDFDNLRKNPYIIFPFYSDYMIKLFGENKYLNFLKRVMINKYARYIYRNFLVKYVHAVKSYDLHNEHQYYPANLSKIKDLFLPNKEHRIEIDKKFSHLKKMNKTIIGVHVRRGDYANWRGGKYYYTKEEYINFIKQTSEIFEDQNIVFYISSNEDISAWFATSKYQLCDILENSAAKDLYALSKCDYILGPPSTFSRWASLMGHVPIYQIWDKEERIQLNSFSPLKYLDEREDGLKYI